MFGQESYGDNFTSKANGIDGNVPDLAGSRIALGGIELGVTPERVRTIYGAPDGISVGDTVGKLYQAYGRAAKYGEILKEKSYTYRNGHRVLSFKVKGDKIVSISIFVE